MSGEKSFLQMSWAKRRSIGARRCTWILTTDQKSHETSGGNRLSFHKKGQQCSGWATKSEIALTGVPICNSHLRVFNEMLDEDKATRARLRAKLDPGPLYDEDDL